MSSQAVPAPSALAGIWGEMIGEFFGTMILILFGDGVVATVFLYSNLGANGAASPFATEWIVIILGWGLAVMLGIYVAGQFNSDLRRVDQIVSSPVAAAIGKASYYVLPDFARFDVKLAVVHGIPVSGTYIASAVGYAALYVAALLFGAVVLFNRRDFK